MSIPMLPTSFKLKLAMKPGKIKKHLHFLLNELSERAKRETCFPRNTPSQLVGKRSYIYSTDAISKCDFSSSKI